MMKPGGAEYAVNIHGIFLYTDAAGPLSITSYSVSPSPSSMPSSARRYLQLKLLLDHSFHIASDKHLLE